MNKHKLKDLKWSRVRLRRPAKSVLNGKVIAQRDDTWIVTDVRSDGVVEIQNIVTSHVAKLGHDYIHHFDSDPQSEWDGLRHGFLQLTQQIYMSGFDLWMEPLSQQQRRTHLARPPAAFP